MQEHECQSNVSAGKIHVLGLDPIKEKLGDKWKRLSGLVHKLFETAIKDAQSPSDQYVVLDELSYALVFHDLSFEEADRICASISTKVCKALFGEQIDEVSVRSVVSAIKNPPLKEDKLDIGWIEDVLERSGSETIYAQSVQSSSKEPVAIVERNKLRPQPSGIEQIKNAHDELGKCGLQLGFFPIWDLHRGTSSALSLKPFRGSANQPRGIGRFPQLEGEPLIKMEIAVLNGANAYATRLAEANQICAVFVPVSYKMLSGFHARIRYITALQAVHARSSTPLVLQIDAIPSGTPAIRIGELSAMMRFPNTKVTLKFQSLRAIPDFDFQLSVASLDGVMPADSNVSVVEKITSDFVRTASLQKVTTLIEELDTPESVSLARHCNVRFGIGTALSMRSFSGLEDIPKFPLSEQSLWKI
ncbi:MAG TPA: hypothetical protein VMU01_06740 [Rhizomicrobium sp.]|nr:hypothetical protein [Rhizomicrobium sp.]